MRPEDPEQDGTVRSDSHPCGNDSVLADLVFHYIERLNAGEYIDEAQVLRDEPALGPAVVTELQTYLYFGSRRPAEDNEPLGTLGDYTLRREIGRGGMGVVYDAWQNSMDRQVALKVLPAGIAADHKAFHRFMREAKTAGHLHHQNVVAVYAMGVDDNTPYYAMEYVEGETLAQILAKIRGLQPESNTTFGRKDCAGYFENLAAAFADVADGLQHAHSKGVIHRDIKPSNLILDTEGHLRILDFGLARLEGHSSLTVSGDVVGTPLYMSPEQARRRKIPVDHRTDVYSLGATLYEMLTLRPPFRGKDHADTLSQIIEREPTRPSAINPRVPKDLETIVLKCLRKRLLDRYGTAEALAQDLRRLMRGDPVEARPQPTWERIAARVRRQRTRLVVAAVFVTLAVALCWLAYRSERATEIARQAKLEAQQAAYEPAVREVLKKIYAGQYSLQVVEGELEGHFFKFSGSSLARMTPGEIEALWRGRGAHPVEAAAQELAQLASVVGRPDGHYHLARAFLLLGRKHDAKTALEKALAHDSDFVPAKVLELDLEVSSNRELELEALCSEYGARSDWRGAWVRAHKSVTEQDWPRALKAYGELIDLSGRGTEPYIGCALEAYLGRGMARLHFGKYEKAKGDFHKASALAPGSVAPILLLGKSQYLDDDVAEVDDTFSELYDTASPVERNETALWIAGVYYSLKDYAKGLYWADQLGEEVPIRERLRSYFLFRGGETDKAIDAGRRAISRNKEDLVAHLVLASALREALRGRSGVARTLTLFELDRVSKRALELNSGDSSARKLLGTAQAEWNYLLWRRIMSTLRSSRAVSWVLPLVLWLGGTTPAQEGFLEVGGPLLDPHVDWYVPCLSADGLTLYFGAELPGGHGGVDIWFSRRERKIEENGDTVAFTEPFENLAEVNSPLSDSAPLISANGKRLYFSRDADLWVASRETFEDGNGFGPPESLENISSPMDDVPSSITRDERFFFFYSDRDGGQGGYDIWMASREAVEDEAGNWIPFDKPVPVAEVNTGQNEMLPMISPDGLTLFFSRFDATVKIYVAKRARTEDENGDPVRFEAPEKLGLPLDSLDHDWFMISWEWPNCGAQVGYARGWPIPIGYLVVWHPDCNQNGQDDCKDIEDGVAADSNANGIPDECEPGDWFRRGDSNGDGELNLTDATFTLFWLFTGGPEPRCLAALNANGDDKVDITDGVALLAFLFADGPAPVAPFPDCGPSMLDSDETLGCETPPQNCLDVP